MSFARGTREQEVDAAAAEGMRRAESPLTAQEWRERFERGLPKFLSWWESTHGKESFTIHDMYDSGLPLPPEGGDCAGPAILAASRAGIIRRIGEKKSTRVTQHRRVSAYVRGGTT